MKYTYLFILLIFGFQTVSNGQTDAPKTIVSYKEIGKLKSRNTHEIKSSNWSVGGETMDRGYTEYKYWSPYLADLGIKKVRLQAGWAKCEKVKGVYTWAWLDSIVFDLPKKGIEPWVNLSYGNPLYGKGETHLGSKIDTDKVTMTAWLNWVKAIVVRYKDVVNEWEIWNEPNGGHNSAVSYAKLLIPTAELIKKIQPNAVIIGLAEAGIDMQFTEGVLKVLKNENKTSLIDYLCYHPYNFNPDDSYTRVEELYKLMKSYAPEMKLFQGENGAPSEWINSYALSKYNWTEVTQAKWALRRMLGDLGRDIPSSLFTIADVIYPNTINRKGLLYVNNDKTINHRKQAYFAVQNLAAIFDNTLEKINAFDFKNNSNHKVAAFAYKKKNDRPDLVTIWLYDDRPTDYNATTPINFEMKNVTFKNPVWIDLRTGNVFEIPNNCFESKNGNTHFKNLPVYDSPIVVAEKKIIQIK